MNDHIKNLLKALTLVAIFGGAAWWWYGLMELRWGASPDISQAARENPMLAATRLLSRNGHAVALADAMSLLAIDKLPDGTLIVGDASGVVTPEKGRQLLAWVRRGNTLVAQPRWTNPAEAAQLAALRARAAAGDVDEEEADDEEAEGDDEDGDADENDAEAGAHGSDDAAPDQDGAEGEDDSAAGTLPLGAAARGSVEVDPLAAYLGVRLHLYPEDIDCSTPADKRPATRQRPAPCPPGQAGTGKAARGSIVLPGAPYALELSTGYGRLVNLPKGAAPAWTDSKGSAIHAYPEGRGRIVMVNTDYFNNNHLKRYDHAELLLALARLNPGARQVTLVKHLDAPRWYLALWERYRYALLALAAALALLLWAALRRFGPLLPAPGRERRSLLEHIDASGAWLWSVDGGSALLREAAREDTLALIRRRAPGMLRLAPQERNAALARECGVSEADIDAALHQDSLPRQHEFTRQIRTLQELRNHYDR